MSDYRMTFEGSPLIWWHWYWLITDESTMVFSAESNDKISVSDARYTDWLASHPKHVAGQVATDADLYSTIWPLNRQVAYLLPTYARQTDQGSPPGGPDIPPEVVPEAAGMFHAFLGMLIGNPELRAKFRQALGLME